MLSISRTAAVTVVVSALCSACSTPNGEPDARPVATRTDSAGVEIVFSEVPLAGAPVFAEVGPDPTLRLGSLDGADEEQFGSIRALAPLPDGGVAVLDQQAAQVRLFGAEGAYRGTLGSRGDGPGEFMSPAALALLHGDTMAVYDRRAHRVTWYAVDGGDPVVHTLQGGGTSFPSAGNFFPDGRMVGSLRWFAGDGPSLPNEGEDQVSLDSAVIAVYSAQGALIDTAAVIPNRETLQRWTRAGSLINVAMTSVAFARTGVFAAHPDGVWAGFGDRWELRLYDATDGTLRRILRVPGLERPLTSEEMDAARAAAAAGDSTPAQRERTDVWWNLSPRPEVRPTYDQILVDDQARIWLREWGGVDRGPERWWVFQGAGDLLGSVDVPAHITLMAVSGGDVWGVLRDELDVQYVVRHALTVAEP